MSEKDKDTKAGESSGTLRDDASGKPAGGKGKGGVFHQMFGGGQPSAPTIGEAIEGHVRQEEVSQISGLIHLSEFLRPVEGDNEVTLIDGEEITKFQARVLERMTVLRDLRDDYDIKSGKNDPTVKTINEQLLNLQAFLNSQGIASVEKSSVLFDINMLAEQLKKDAAAETPLEIGDKEFRIPPEGTRTKRDSGNENLIFDVGPTSSAVEPAEGENLFDEVNPGEEKFALEEEAGNAVSGKREAIAEVATESTGVEEEGAAQPEEPEMDVEEIPEEGVEIDVTELGGDVEPATLEAEKPEDSEKEGVGELNMTQVSLGRQDPEERDEDSWFDTGDAKGKPRGMGTNRPGSSVKMDGTVVGVNAAVVPKKETESGDRLSQPDLFKEFDNDPEVGRETEERSSVESLGNLIKPLAKAGARMPTVGLAHAAHLDRLEDTGIDGRSPTVEEMARTRLSAPGVQEDPKGVPSIEVSEDFSKYGDIFYVVKQAFAEMGEDPGKVEGFEANLELAIEYSELIANDVDTIYDGDLTGSSPEYRRVQRLRAFKKEFIDVAEGSTEPKKDIGEYGFWITAKIAEYERIEDVFDTLEIAPGEYSRNGVLRICEVALQSNGLETGELEKVHALMEMLKEKPDESDADEFAAARVAELTYEMVVGFATKRDRNRARGMLEYTDTLQRQLRDRKISANQSEEKLRGIGTSLAELYVAMKRVDNTQVNFTGMVPEVKDRLLRLEPDYIERKKIMSNLFDAVAPQKGDGNLLYAAAKAKAERALGMTESSIKTAMLPEAIPPRQAGPIRKGIGNLVTMTAGAAILAAGMWLNQHGIISLGNDSVAPEQEKVVEVQEKEIEGDVVPSLPAGVVDGTLDGAPEVAPEEKTKRPTEEELEEAPLKIAPKAKVEYPRTPWGLSAALNAHCSEDNARGLFTSVNMLREAYATVESDLAKKGILPQDKNWPEKIFRLRIRDPGTRVAIMADLLRRSDEGGMATLPQKYAAGFVLAIDLGNRGGRPKRFKLAQGEKETGSPIGKLESVKKSLLARFAAVSAYRQVVKLMEQMKKESLAAGKTSKEFEAEVDRILGPRAKQYRKAFHRAQGAAQDIYAKSEAKGGYRESYQLHTQGRSGMGGISAIDWVLGKQKKNQKNREQRNQELDAIIGETPEGTVKKRMRPGTPAKKAKSRKKTPPKDESTLEFLERKAEEKIESSRAGHTANYRDGLSIRMGMGENKIENSVRREKKEAYSERFRFRGGVEKKPSPFKRIAAKLGMNKGLGKTTARA